MKCSLLRLFSLLIFTAFICAAQKQPSKAFSVSVVPFYMHGKGVSDGLPAGYFDKGDTIKIISTKIDSLGNPWFITKLPDSVKVITTAEEWRYLTGNQKQNDGISGFADKQDRVRRMKILRKHRDWPRRIIRAVREGGICLDMSREHVVASWGEPFQQSPSFMLGIGKYSTMFFKNDDSGVISAVYLTNGKVSGWSGGSKGEGE